MAEATTAGGAAGTHAALPSMTTRLYTMGTVLRPLIFVVDATHPPPSHGGGVGADDGDEPFDVRRNSLAASGDFMDDTGEHLYESFLAALRGKPPNSGESSYVDEELSLAASFASSAPPYTPREGFGDESIMDSSSPPPASASKRFMSPFSRLRVGRWKASSPVGTLDDDATATTTSASTAHHVLAQDMEDDHDFSHDGTFSSHSDNVSSALSSYSKDNPPVNFMSKRARIVSVSRRHAFPPSKFPRGKMDPNAAGIGVSGVGTTMMLGEQPGSNHGGTSWMSSYEIQNEGILPSGWLEKHARALPSAVVVVATLKVTNDETRRLSMKNASRAVEDLRQTLAEKRSVPIHLVCLLKEDEASKEMKLRNLNAIREKICQETYLPQSQVFIMKCPGDLVPDEFESQIMRSPYLESNALAAAQGGPTTPCAAVSPSSASSQIMMNPMLRQLDRSLRDTSALYYSRLADAQERKLQLWRNRYHGTNASFDVNTLMAAMRCARYAMKVGTLREFQMRTGGNAGGGGGSNGRWADKASAAMRHYDEAYRWIVELHRRAIAWRATALSATAGGGASGSAGGMSFPSPAPITPGGKNLYSMDGIASPKLTESPGGGIGVELSLPGAHPPPPAPSLSGATPPPPPMRRNSPALTSKKGYNTAENIAFFACLWEQCRAVGSILNAKLLRSTTSPPSSINPVSTEAEEQWSRHRIIFLSNPQSIPNFIPSSNDDFFGPAWHRFLYVMEELLTFACIAEGRWRRALSTHASGKSTTVWSSSYHQTGAPWKAYGELCEAMLGLRKVIKRQSDEPYSNEWLNSSSFSGRRKFVGSIVSGESGFGTMTWRFENESKKDHRATALDYVLHALDLLDENISLCSGGGNTEILGAPIQQPNSSARLHYLAARLLMTLDDPNRAMVHLKIASTQTKSWPSLHLSIQRALFACEERCAAMGQERGGLPASPSAGPPVLPSLTESKDSCIELLLRSESFKLLSAKEKKDALRKAWKDDDPAVGTREVLWTHDDTSRTEVPFEFAVSFLNSTHAMSSDTVTACVSIKSCLDFEACVESLQLVTTSGTYDVSNLEQCGANKEVLQSWLHKEHIGGTASTSLATKYVQNRGVRFDPNDLAFFMTELSLPSNLSDIALGGASVDTSKFIPKNGRLCNMGLSHAAGNICESRFENGVAQQKISINGKPIALSSIADTSSSFLGGIPLICHGVILTLKRADGVDSSTLKLQIEQPRLVSPLLRYGSQRLLMEESNYTAHSWSRPAHHPWCLGPRVLRVLGPRPHMHVTNLTDSQTDCRAVEGTVNRIMFKLEAGSDEDCWDVRVRLKCKSSKKLLAQAISESVNHDTAEEEGSTDVEPHRMPTFVQKSADPTVKNVTENGVALPDGWDPRNDVGTDEYHDVTSTISLHLGAGKSLLFPLDVFRPLDQSSMSPESDASPTCSTTYEVIIMYRQVRAGKKGKNKSDEAGDQVMVMQSGSIEWISPFTAEFSQTNGPQRSFPCGIQHASNMTSHSSAEPPSTGGAELIAADGERVQMRCSLGAKGLGSSIAASILRVTNEIETNMLRKDLYSSDSGLFMNQKKQGSKLSLSYSVSAVRDVESGSELQTIPLGVISVNWKPVSLLLPDDLSPIDTSDEFGSAHGPLVLPSVTPMIFYGPQCQVLPSPFTAKLLKCPSTPKVGAPFCISYQLTNRTAKTQTLILSLNDVQDGDTSTSSSLQLLGTGKIKEEMQMAPFEEKTFSFNLLAMIAGKVRRPPLTVSSGRHKTWVINEANSHLFVMP